MILAVSVDVSTVASCDALYCRGYADLATSTTSWIEPVRLRVAPIHSTVQSTPTHSYQRAIVLDDRRKVGIQTSRATIKRRPQHSHSTRIAMRCTPSQ